MYEERYLTLPAFDDDDDSDSLTLRPLMHNGSALKSFMNINLKKKALSTSTENVYDTYEDYEIVLQVVDDNSNDADNGALTDSIYLNVKVHKVNRPPFFRRGTLD